MMATSSLPPNYSLSDLQSLNEKSAYYSTEVSYTDIREQAIQEAALTLGTQAGLNYESGQIDAILTQYVATLDRIFDFNQVMYKDNVLPPVLNTATNLVNINPNGSTIRIAGTTYTILAPARFVTAPPTWRDYIWMNYPIPELPDKTLLPKNSQEEAFWQQNILQGWQAGMNQAASIFSINLNRLVQDFNGMLLYKELLLKNMVSPYAVDRTEQGITGNGQNMVIDDQTLQLTTQPQLLLNSSYLWQALPRGIQAPAPLPEPVAALPANEVASPVAKPSPDTTISPEAPELTISPAFSFVKSAPAQAQPKPKPTLTAPAQAKPTLTAPAPAAPLRPIAAQTPPAVVNSVSLVKAAPQPKPMPSAPLTTVSPVSPQNPVPAPQLSLVKAPTQAPAPAKTAQIINVSTPTAAPASNVIDLDQNAVQVLYPGQPQNTPAQPKAQPQQEVGADGTIYYSTKEAVDDGNQSDSTSQ